MKSKNTKEKNKQKKIQTYRDRDQRDGYRGKGVERVKKVKGI